MLIATSWATVGIGIGLVVMSLLLHLGVRYRTPQMGRLQLLTRPEWLLLLPGLVLVCYLPKLLGWPNAVQVTVAWVGRGLDLAFGALLIFSVAKLLIRLAMKLASLVGRTLAHG